MTATFAWYTVSSNLLVSDIKIQLREDDFQIGLSSDDGTTIDYGNSYDQDALKTHGLYDPSMVYQAVSGMYQSKWFDQSQAADSLTPSFRSAFDVSSSTTDSSPITGGFAQFDVYFTSTRALYVYLDETVTSLTPSSNNSSLAKALNRSQESLDKIKDCMRISFLSESPLDDEAVKSQYLIYEPNAETGSTTYYGGRLNIKGEDDYYDVDSSGNEIVYGEYSDSSKIIYDADSAVKDVSSESVTCFTSNSVGSLGFDFDASQANGLGISQEKTYTLDEMSSEYGFSSSTHPICYLNGFGDTQKVTVSIYLEGWDRDMTDDVLSAQFDLKLSFAGLLKEKL